MGSLPVYIVLYNNVYKTANVVPVQVQSDKVRPFFSHSKVLHIINPNPISLHNTPLVVPIKPQMDNNTG